MGLGERRFEMGEWGGGEEKGSMEKPHIPASTETMSEYWFHKTGTKTTISVFQISKF